MSPPGPGRRPVVAPRLAEHPDELDVDMLERRKLRLLAHANGDHLHAQLLETVTRLRARRLALQGPGR